MLLADIIPGVSNELLRDGGMGVVTIAAVVWLIKRHDRNIRLLTKAFSDNLGEVATSNKEVMNAVVKANKESVDAAQEDNRANSNKTYDLAGKTIQVLEHLMVKITNIHELVRLLPEIREILKHKLEETKEHKPVQ